MDLLVFLHSLALLLVPAPAEDRPATSAVPSCPVVVVKEDGAFKLSAKINSNQHGVYRNASRQHPPRRSLRRGGVSSLAPGALYARLCPLVTGIAGSASSRPVYLGPCLYLFMALLR